MRSTARRLSLFAATLAALFIAPAGLTAQTQALTFTPGSGSPGSNNDQSVGWQFNVLTGITVNGLGWYDDGANGLSIGHSVGIWDPSGTLLTSILVPGGTAAGLNGQYRCLDRERVPHAGRRVYHRR